MYRKINGGIMAEDKKEEIKIIEINEEYMKDRLYVFRGRKVMLVYLQQFRLMAIVLMHRRTS